MFAHLFIPHAPYLFDKDGASTSPLSNKLKGLQGWSNTEGYLNEIQFISSHNQNQNHGYLSQQSQSQPLIQNQNRNQNRMQTQTQMNHVSPMQNQKKLLLNDNNSFQTQTYQPTQQPIQTQLNQFSPMQQQSIKSGICRFYLHGFCYHGQQCRYIHDN